ncbi:hypothetical protein DFH07DRAFT_772997 [Mycena maculata]|uniref:Uncharacterized protein n=1 Tax=Mycena maculata TaxID=230809 RepID=A0AAD7J8G2_9AGAR|nr:hypothetical protein DFH07DRAFT_772997 [Mycena maculata]
MCMHTFPVAPGTEHTSVPAAAVTPTDPAAGKPLVVVVIAPSHTLPAKAAALQLLVSALATLTEGTIHAHSVYLLHLIAPPAHFPATVNAPAATTAAPAGAVDTTPPAVPTGTGGFHTCGPWIAGAFYVVVPAAPLQLIAEPPRQEGDEGDLWYAITKGTYVGVHQSQGLALAAVSSVSSSSMRSYKTQALAVAAFNEMLGYNMVSIVA